MERTLQKTFLLASLGMIAVGAVGCIEHRVKADPIEVKPIHITVDVNIRVDRELDDFFDFEDEIEEKLEEKE